MSLPKPPNAVGLRSATAQNIMPTLGGEAPQRVSDGRLNSLR